MNFITNLPNVKGYNQCWVIVDRFTNIAHFIPLKNRKAKQLALIFVREVWTLHGLPKRIVPDRDTVFMSSFWSEVMRLLEVELDKSSTYHPQTAGQTELVNQILEHYLLTYCMWDQDDWVDLLPFAEFCYNNNVHTATKQTLFFAAYHQHPENNFKNRRDNRTESNNPEAVKTVEDLDAMREAMRENMKAAQTWMPKYYNQKVDNKEPQFKVGDWVMDNAKNIKTKRPSKKVDYKLWGKFEIEKPCGTNAYRLKLPPLSSKIDPVFHVSLLEPYRRNTIPGRRSSTSPPVDLEQQEYVIEKIKTTFIKGGQVKYLVSWKGYGPDEDTWEPYENLKAGGEHVVPQFHLDNLRKLRDPEVLI